MILDIYTDARSEIVKYSRTAKNSNLSQKLIQISSVVIDEHENEFKLVEVTNTDKIKNEWDEFIGVEFKSSSTIGEMYSIYKVLGELCKLESKIDCINIYTDSLTSFFWINEIPLVRRPTQKPKCHKPNHKLVKKLNTNIISIKKTLESVGVKVNIMWVKAHCGVWGNELADSLCKKSYKEINEFNLISK